MRKLFSLFVLVLITYLSYGQNLTTKVFELPEVIYVADAVTVSNDTLTYNVTRITTLADKNIEDLLRKLPGVDIDASGAIRYNDKLICHFYIEGIDLLGGGYTLATRHIRPEDLLSIQVLENHQPIKVMKGYATSDRAAINIKLKKSRLARPIGYAQAGAGKENSVSANAMTHMMKIDNDLQQLIHLGTQYDSFLLNESGVTDVGSELSLKSDIERNVFSIDLFSTPAFAKKRYMSNRDVEANYSTAIKRDNGQIVKLNASYDAFRNGFSQSVLSELQGDDNVIEREESNSSVYHTQKAKINFETETNKESLYLKHISALRLNQQANDYFVSTNYNGATQEHLKTPLVTYSNSTSLAIPINDYRLQANVSMGFANRPNNRMWFETANDSVRGTSYLQKFEGTSFVIKGNTSYQHSFNSNFNVGTSLNAEYNYDDIGSRYFKEESVLSENRLYASAFHLQLIPFLKWSYFRETLTIELPIDWRLASFKTQGKDHNYNKLNPDIRITNSMKFNRLLYLEATLKESHSYGTLFDFFSGPLRASYLQTTRMGNDEWTFRKSYNADMMLMYRNPLEGTNLSLSAAYRNIENSSINNYSIGTAEDVTSAIKLKNTQQLADVSVLASKQFYDQQLGIKLMSSLGYANRTYIRSSIPFDLSSIYSSTSFHLDKTMFAKRLNVSVSGGMNQSRSEFSAKGSADSLSDISNIGWTMDAKAYYSPADHWSAYISYNAQWNKRDIWEYDKYLEGGVTFNRNSHEFNLTVTNIFNERTWRINEISLVDKRFYSFELMPIGINLCYKYNF